jgi:photosystem II stability/assembly factor-like uncharacterized protein
MLLGMFVAASAQLSFEASSEYGKLWDITYDQTISGKLYARSGANHIMVSTDNGSSWQIFFSFPSSITAISQLKLLPGGKALSFVVSYSQTDEVNGLYILDLATQSIRQHFVMPNLDVHPWVTSYSIYDSAATIVLLNTGYSLGFSPYTKVYYTKDASKNWKEVYYSDSYNTVQILNTAIAPDDPAKLILMRGLGSQGVNGGLFISTNEGKNWTWRLGGSAFCPIAFNPQRPKEFFVGSFVNFGMTPETLYRTLDGGTTFSKVPITWNDQILNHITLIQYAPSDTTTMWMLEENEILKSSNGGSTWTSTSFEPNSTVFTGGISIAINPQNNHQLFITSDAWPQYSLDGGKTLIQLKNPFYVTDKVTLGDYPHTSQLYYCSQGGYIIEDLSTRKTQAFNIQPPYMVNVRGLTAIADTTVQGRLFLFKGGDDFGNSAQLMYSDNYGTTLHNLPTEDFATYLKLVKKDPNSNSRYWISYSFNEAYSTLYTLDISDSDNPVATPVTPPGNGVINAAYIAPGNNGNTVYISVGAKVYLSEDGGLTWTTQSQGLENLTDGYDNIWDMNVNPYNPQMMAIATTQGIFQSEDGGKNWTLTFAANDLKKVSFSNATEGHIMAASYTSLLGDTRLVFSTNAGAKWFSVPAGSMGYLQCSSSIDFKFYSDHADIYFATSDLGVVKYQLNNLLSPQLLHLTAFTGILVRGNALLSWNTVDEQELSDYQLERSTNNRDFQLINTQQASGNDGFFTYNYEDPEFSGLAATYRNVYYRLKITGTDKSFAYSDTVKLSATDMYIYPVPASDVINLHVHGVTEPAKYRVLLVDASGRQYSIQSYNIPTGSTTISMPITRLVSGMYIMLVETRSGEIRKFKFLKL